MKRDENKRKEKREKSEIYERGVLQGGKVHHILINIIERKKEKEIFYTIHFFKIKR